MIHLMLNDLRRPAGKVFRTCLHIQGLILHLDGLIALALARAAEKRQGYVIIRSATPLPKTDETIE